MKKNTEVTVIDFFCGAGGFSEGFRQKGFKVVEGLDHWGPAVRSHNLNHGLNDEPRDILEFGDPTKGLEAIHSLPDTDVIVGSPPCVSFSMANKAGKADKGLGIRLIESYLRVVAVKKHQRGGILKAWLMENVPNSKNFVQPTYSFRQLGLADWAKSIGKNPSDIALNVKGNGDVLCAADYGSPQTRQRFVCGEMVKTEDFPAPPKTHSREEYVTLKEIRSKIPPPTGRSGDTAEFVDPNYKHLKMKASDLPDHFYDTGLYKVEYRSAQFAKQNHPFMGRMSFPEAENRPSRTIMATRSGSTRESLIFESELQRKGDGEYRLPTIREAATLMGFPYPYQFVGSEGTKWKQIGNAVCPHMSAALANEIRRRMGLGAKKGKTPFNSLVKRLDKKRVNDLNTFRNRVFDSPPRRKRGSKFRRHPFKNGNMTIALTNFNPDETPHGKVGVNWSAVAYLGAGKKYDIKVLTEENHLAAWSLLEKELTKPGLRRFRNGVDKIVGRVPNGDELCRILEENETGPESSHPVDLVDDLAVFLNRMDPQCVKLTGLDVSVVDKATVPLRQVMAVAAICEIAMKASPVAWKR